MKIICRKLFVVISLIFCSNQSYSQSIQVNWAGNKNVDSYVVYFETTQLKQQRITNKTNVVLTGITQNRLYKIQVAAIQNDNIGERSFPVFVSTTNSIPKSTVNIPNIIQAKYTEK